MNLPNYFLADLPPEASLTATIITEACQTLKRNRERFLAERSTEQLIRILAKVAKNWLDPEFSFRKFALELGPGQTGFPEPVLRAGLDSFFAQITPGNLDALILQEFGEVRRLDAFVASDADAKSERNAKVHGPELLVHITGGVLPNPILTSIIYGLLVRSAQFVKCASGTSFLPRLFAHSLYEEEPKLGACLEIAEWKGGQENLERALFADANCVTATGSDETLAKIQTELPGRVRFIGYGHRVSFGYVTRQALTISGWQNVVKAAARDVVSWNQLGCLSPHVLYVEAGGDVSPERFAEALATELEAHEQTNPRGKLRDEESAAIAYRRSFYEVRVAGTAETRLWSSKGSTAWTVVYENDPRFQLSCLNRFIYVKAVANLEEALRGADPVYGKVSTVGVAAPVRHSTEIAGQLARWGATRVCRLGQMQNPSLLWRHDGRSALGDLVTWTDHEI